jgi:hypothetical protein
MNTKRNTKRIILGIGIFTLFGLLLMAIASGSQTEAKNEKPAVQFPVCSNATLGGNYAVIGDGFVPSGPPPAPMVPFANMSLMTLDGTGNLTNKITVSRNGQISQNLDSGTYTVNPDCTGTMAITIPTPPFQLTFNLVVADMQGNHGREFYFIATTNSVVTHTAKRIQ